MVFCGKIVVVLCFFSWSSCSGNEQLAERTCILTWLPQRWCFVHVMEISETSSLFLGGHCSAWISKDLIAGFLQTAPESQWLAHQLLPPPWEAPRKSSALLSSCLRARLLELSGSRLSWNAPPSLGKMSAATEDVWKMGWNAKLQPEVMSSLITWAPFPISQALANQKLSSLYIRVWIKRILDYIEGRYAQITSMTSPSVCFVAWSCVPTGSCAMWKTRFADPRAALKKTAQAMTPGLIRTFMKGRSRIAYISYFRGI